MSQRDIVEAHCERFAIQYLHVCVKVEATGLTMNVLCHSWTIKQYVEHCLIDDGRFPNPSPLKVRLCLANLKDPRR